MEIRLGGSNARGKNLSIAAVGVAIALALVDFVVLRGEHVYGATVRLSSGDPALIEISRVGEGHLVEISTRHRRGGRSRAVL